MSLVTDAGSQKDAYLDEAQTFIDKALEIYPDESELYVLQGLLHQGRIQVAPKERGLVYSQKAAEALNLAKDYNPENPRIYYLMGLNEIFIAQATGGGLDEACGQLKTAVDKFKTSRPQHVLSPTWGGERNQQYYSRYCGDQN
jgi:tetratricopeptide (TPR) repeat protein